jgi:hypothetical protein
MIFIETSIFTKEIERLLPDDSYRKLQSVLMLRPEAGSVIRGSGACGRSAGTFLVPESGGHCESSICGVLRIPFSCCFHTEKLNRKI